MPAPLSMSYPPVSPKRILVLALLAVIGLCLASLVVPRLPVGGYFGAMAANRDVAQGLYAYKTPFQSTAWEKEWKRTLHCEYGIQIKGQEGSKAPFLTTYDQAYNRVQLAAIESRFGSNVVFTTRDRLRQVWSNKTAKS